MKRVMKVSRQCGITDSVRNMAYSYAVKYTTSVLFIKKAEYLYLFKNKGIILMYYTDKYNSGTVCLTMSAGPVLLFLSGRFLIIFTRLLTSSLPLI